MEDENHANMSAWRRILPSLTLKDISAEPSADDKRIDIARYAP